MDDTQVKYVHADVETAKDINQFLTSSRLFETACLSVLQQGHRSDDGNSFFVALIHQCYEMGLSEQDTATMINMRYHNQAPTVLPMLHNIYAERNGSYKPGHAMTAEQRRCFLLEEFLKRNYHLRYNIMMRQTEYADRTLLQCSYRPLTDRVRYEIISRAQAEGISLWDQNLRQRLMSTAVRDFSPMEDFLMRLPRWDGKPRIKQLAQTIPTGDREWPDRFYRWFLSMVAHWQGCDPRFGNGIIPVLVGPQGCGKSQWIRGLLPEEMQAYYHDGFDFRCRTEAEAMMTRYALINIDEFDAISPRQEPVLKHLVQLSQVHIEGQPQRRFCSFIATSNHRELHRDTSGSRRYIFVEIDGQIKLNHRLSLLQVYAEAVAAIKDGSRTWFTKVEETEMQQSNEAFREQDIAEQLFLNYFQPLAVREDVDGGEWQTAIAIFRRIETMTKKDLGVKRANCFGRILRKHCAPHGVKRGDSSCLYHVKARI